MPPKAAPIGTHTGAGLASSATGQEFSFPTLLVALAGAGWFMLRGRHSYVSDVASAAATQVDSPPRAQQSVPGR